MNRKRLVLLSGAALVVLLVSLIGATVVFADEPNLGLRPPLVGVSADAAPLAMGCSV